MDLDVYIQKRVVYIMKKKISICKVSQISIVLTAVIAIILSALISFKKLHQLTKSNKQKSAVNFNRTFVFLSLIHNS